MVRVTGVEPITFGFGDRISPLDPIPTSLAFQTKELILTFILLGFKMPPALFYRESRRQRNRAKPADKPHESTHSNPSPRRSIGGQGFEGRGQHALAQAHPVFWLRIGYSVA